MPGTKNRISQPPANARERRMAHAERDQALKARKRTRRLRGEIHAAMSEAARLTKDSPWIMTGPFRATDQKIEPLDGLNPGWEIVDGQGRCANTAPSRDKARARAREMTANGVQVTRMMPSPFAFTSPEEAMLSLGWRRTGAKSNAPAEQKYERVSS